MQRQRAATRLLLSRCRTHWPFRGIWAWFAVWWYLCATGTFHQFPSVSILRKKCKPFWGQRQFMSIRDGFYEGITSDVTSLCFRWQAMVHACPCHVFMRCEMEWIMISTNLGVTLSQLHHATQNKSRIVQTCRNMLCFNFKEGEQMARA